MLSPPQSSTIVFIPKHIRPSLRREFPHSLCVVHSLELYFSMDLLLLFWTKRALR